MLDLTAIPESLRLARGDYSSVRAAHEDAMKELARLCGELQSIAGQMLRRMQPTDDDPELIEPALVAAHTLLSEIETQYARAMSLGKQRAELKKIAWGA